MNVRHAAAALGLAAAAAASVLAAGGAQAQSAPPVGCLLVVEPGSSRWTIESYDPYSGQPAYGQFQVAWINQGDKKCMGDAVVQLNSEAYGMRNPAQPSMGLLYYGLVNESTGADLTPSTANSGSFNGPQLQVEPGQRVIQTIGLSVDTQNLSGDGLFQQTVTLGMRRRNSVVYEGQADVTLAINVRPSAVMGLTGAFQRNNGVANITWLMQPGCKMSAFWGGVNGRRANSRNGIEAIRAATAVAILSGVILSLCAHRLYPQS